MRTTVFGYVNVQPLWRKKSEIEDLDELSLSVIIGTFGLIFIDWVLSISIMGSLGNILIKVYQEKVPLINILFANLYFNAFLAILVNLAFFYYISHFGEDYPKFSIRESVENLKSKIIDTKVLESNFEKISEKTINFRFLSDFIFIFFFGVLTGSVYTILWFLPVFMIFIGITFILGIFIPAFSINLIVGSLIAWIIIFRFFILNNILKIGSIEDKKRSIEDYEISDRRIEILVSNKPPIICPGCRSYISADSKICKICGDEIT